MVVKIQTLWIGASLPKIINVCIRSMAEIHEVHLYTYCKVDNIPENTSHDIVIKDANEIIKEEDIFYFEGDIAPFSDLFRFKLLLLKGGYWLDTDIFLLKSINYRNTEFIIGSERTIVKGAFKSKLPYKPNIGFLKAKRKSKFYSKIVEECEKKIKNGLKKRTDLMVVFQNQIEKFGMGYTIKTPEFYCNLDWWFTKEAFEVPLEKHWNQKYGWDKQDDYLENIESIGIHLWAGLISKKNINSEKYAEGSLVDILIKSIEKKPTFLIKNEPEEKETITITF